MSHISENNRELPTSLRIRQGLDYLKRLSAEERVQLLVDAELLSQEEADKAKKRLAQKRKKAK